MSNIRNTIPIAVTLCVAVISVAAFGGIAVGVTDTDKTQAQAAPTDPIVSANQSVPETAEAGETVPVEVTVELSEPSQRIDITTEFSPAVKDITVIDDGGATIAETTNANDVLAASYGSVESVTLQYDIVIPTNASTDDPFDLNTTVTVDDTYERSPADSITVVDKSIESTDRSVPAGAKAGDSVTVTTNVILDSPVSDLNITETIDPAVDQATIVDSDGATVATATSGEVVGSWGDTDRVTLTYELTLPKENVSTGDKFTINGTVANGDTTAMIEPDTIVISEVPGAVEYADKETGKVTTDGIFSAAADFRDGNAGPRALLDTAAAYRSGSAVF
ncbi:hypothetical protein PM022_12510 [Halorubrum ezzemoulense]|uniref:hypothetical protein n=1 Tax=Halorubrum ezzemoulense TaxID=337243 RepID=UPI00232CC1BB|nr:hypothetical protein [Halorubrum ezzemoulense]MDB2275352.1 hypothetical protein [Halorubrum ezzemoulense]